MLKIKKLALNTQTLRSLTSGELAGVRGAAMKRTWMEGGNACSYTNHDSQTPCGVTLDMGGISCIYVTPGGAFGCQ